MCIKKSEEPVERSFIQQQMSRRSATEPTDNTPPLSVENGLNRSYVYEAITNSLDSLINSGEEVSEFTTFKTVNMEIMKVLDRESVGPREGIFWTFYIPFFSHIAHSIT